METLMFLIGGCLLIIAFGIKILTILGVKFQGIELHKVEHKKVTIVEKAIGLKAKVEPKELPPGLYPMIKISPFYVIKKANIPTYQYAITFFAGMDEQWEDWETNPTHSSDDIDWDKTSGIELDGGSTAVIECLLVFSIDDPIAFVYNNEEPIATMVMIAKAIVKDVISGKISFSGLMELSQSAQEDMVRRIRESVMELNLGIDIKKPDADHSFIKNPHPCPETKKGRAIRFEAKQKGKAEVELSTGTAKSAKILANGESKAEQIRKKGKGKGIKQMAEKAGITPQEAFAYETVTETTKNLEKATFVQTDGNSLMSNVASMIGVGKSILEPTNDDKDKETTKGDGS